MGDSVNFYAVVLDATYPHQSHKSKKYLATLKVADMTSRMDGKLGTADFISIVFFADKFDDLPKLQKVGDIIRVHRATVATYKDRKQITANVCFNSSWAVFPLYFKGQNLAGSGGGARPQLADEFATSLFFGKSIQVQREEHTVIRNLRKWAIASFANKPVLSNQFIVKLADVPTVATPSADRPNQYNDFDIQVKILQLFKVDEYKSEMRVIDDSNEIWHTQIYNVKYPLLREGSYVRIRACTLYNFANKGYERTFGLRPQSNILTLPYPCKLAQDMMFDEFSAKNEFEVKSLTQSGTVMHPIVVSRITDKDLSWKPITDLTRLNEDAKVIEKEVVHRIRVGIVATGLGNSTNPKSLGDCVRIYDKKTGKSRLADANSTLKGKNEHFVFTLPIYVKDSSTRHSAKVNVLNIVDDSADGKSGFFPGIAV